MTTAGDAPESLASGDDCEMASAPSAAPKRGWRVAKASGAEPPLPAVGDAAIGRNANLNRAERRERWTNEHITCR